MSSANDEAAALLGLLQRVQTEALRALGPEDFDPKLYVDLPLAVDRGVVEAALGRLRRPAATPEEMEAFLAEYFAPAGSDVVAASPPDFAAEPPGFLPRVESREARAWALEVHALWKNLARRVALAPAVERHTLLPLPGRVVVPGSRFREVYYWDTYWVVRGLLVSKMYDTAKDIVLNLVYLVEKYGFVLNGARTYYTNRSQPPLLSSMVLDVYMATNDLGFVRRAFPCLLKEHSFWMSDIHNVQIRDHEGQIHNLSRYQAMWNKPRPESATIDEELASNLSSTSDKEKLYHQVASAAESGWDFSSRWMSNSSDLTTLTTTSIIPVDLNTFMCKMERDIAFFSKLIGDSITSEKFLEASKARQTAIDSIFWNSEMEQWLDYWLPNDGTYEGVHQWKANSQNHTVFASNFVPLWLNAHRPGCAPFVDEIRSVRVIRSFRGSGLLHAAGIATSLSNTGQQWDFPNGWAPMQHLIIEALVNCGSAEARNIAEDIATRWIRTNAAAYVATGAMHEKYDVEACGKSGGGGEYKPQTGFGWSNGVILALFEEFGWPQDKEIGPTAYDTSET